MDLTQIISIVTFIVTLVLGFVSKKSKFISNNLIPIQNVLVGIIIAIIEWILTKDFNAAIALSGVMAGGTYDVFHNIKKIKVKSTEGE